MREDANARRRRESKNVREIGKVPKAKNPRRRKQGLTDLEFFLRTYFPAAFTLPFCDDHRRCIQRMQTIIKDGGLFALAMPRGSGKTTIVTRAAMWAILAGHRRFVSVIGATEKHATGLLKAIVSELQNNDLLAEDFPEACHPIRALEGEPRRCKGQICEGQNTNIVWTAAEFIFPTVPKKYRSRSAGSIITTLGLTGAVRGQSHTLSDGTVLRPSLVLADDPQTRESSSSPAQCHTREAIITGDVLGMAGPGRTIAAMMPCTVIRDGDLADTLLDREKHPEWHGERTKMVYSFPKDAGLWDRYADFRKDGLRNGDGGKAANAFYQANREAMDEGAVVAWPERFKPGELSAIQHAMNLKIDSPEAFYAEYQNEPLNPDETAGLAVLSHDQICDKVNGLRRGQAMIGADITTAFIDVQQTCLFYLVAAWRRDFTGSVIDYGTWPEQGRRYFTLREVRKTLADAVPNSGGLEAQIYHGLTELSQQLMNRSWQREDGVALRLNLAMIDANWGQSTQVVREFCRRSQWGNIFVPAHGRFVGASSRPISEWTGDKNERVGLQWRTSVKENLVHVLFDTNFWKTFTHERLAVPFGDRGCLTLFGQSSDHRMLADHILAEYRVRVTGNGRTVDEWKLRAEKPDNHLLDCLVGSVVGASIMGAALQQSVIPTGGNGHAAAAAAPQAKPRVRKNRRRRIVVTDNLFR